MSVRVRLGLGLFEAVRRICEAAVACCAHRRRRAQRGLRHCSSAAHMDVWLPWSLTKGRCGSRRRKTVARATVHWGAGGDAVVTTGFKRTQGAAATVSCTI